MCNFDHRELAWGMGTALDFAPDERRKVSNIEHQSRIETDNMQLKNKEILLWRGCRISGNYSL
jgi:hypothetical protein